ncbi:hypothetical protein BS11774_06620 [Bacillus subtilis]|uniref:hypothetical protein n=1 Tax=Bacillus subtilis TaxID=1423 RepID=UPI000FF8F593|nr:hypothetical protein [Bacillus subtilis]QAR60218.1 hypothetical protein BS11774_06620 [Bacillus subtilis]
MQLFKKRILLLLLFMMSLYLTACNSSDSSNEANNKEDTASENQEDTYQTGNNRSLTEPGQKYKEDTGEIVELNKIKNPDKHIDISPLKVTIDDIKVLTRTNIPSNTLQMYELKVAKQLDEPLSYIQITVTAENTGDALVKWKGITTVIPNTKEQIVVDENNLMENGPHDIYGNAKDEYTIGVIYDGDPEEINSLTLVLGHTYDSESYKTITKEKTIKLDIN